MIVLGADQAGKVREVDEHDWDRGGNLGIGAAASDGGLVRILNGVHRALGDDGRHGQLVLQAVASLEQVALPGGGEEVRTLQTATCWSGNSTPGRCSQGSWGPQHSLRTSADTPGA